MRFAARGGRRPTRRLARGDSIRRRVYRTTTTTERRARAVVVTARRPARTSVPPVERVRAIYFRGARCARVGGFFKPALEVYAFRSFTPTSLSHNIKGRRGFPPRLAPPPPLTHTVPCRAHLSRGQTNRPPLSFSSLEETSGVFVVVRTSSREGKILFPLRKPILALQRVQRRLLENDRLLRRILHLRARRERLHERHQVDHVPDHDVRAAAVVAPAARSQRARVRRLAVFGDVRPADVPDDEADVRVRRAANAGRAAIGLDWIGVDWMS